MPDTPWDERGFVDDFGNVIHWSYMPRSWHIGMHGYHVEHIDACFDNVGAV